MIKLCALSSIMSYENHASWLFADQPIDYEVHILVGDTYYADVTTAERNLMNKCLVLNKPMLTLKHVHLERPCVSVVTGRYLYVVMVILDGSSSTMGINDLNVYTGNAECVGSTRRYIKHGIYLLTYCRMVKAYNDTDRVNIDWRCNVIILMGIGYSQLLAGQLRTSFNENLIKKAVSQQV